MHAKRTDDSDALLVPGRVIGGKYVVEGFIGRGVEGEVYKVKESRTGLTRAAKVFFPMRDVKEKISTWHARKLDKLRHCSAVLQFFHVETVRARGHQLTCLISEFLGGWPLYDFLKTLPGRRLAPFEALHLTYALCKGLEDIHNAREYHGDLHSSNIFVMPRGIFFDVKFIDFYHRGRPTVSERQDDLIDIVHVLHECVGGRRRYANQPPEIKYICSGLRRGLIVKKFPTVSDLRRHLETFEWEV